MNSSYFTDPRVIESFTPVVPSFLDSAPTYGAADIPFLEDPVKFYSSDFKVPLSFPSVASQFSDVAYGTGPSPSAPAVAEKPRGILDYLDAGAQIAGAVRDAVAAYKGFPTSSSRPAGSRLGEFLGKRDKEAEENGEESPAVKNIRRAISTLMNNPDVLVDIFNDPRITSDPIDPDKLREALPSALNLYRRDPFGGLNRK